MAQLLTSKQGNALNMVSTFKHPVHGLFGGVGVKVAV